MLVVGLSFHASVSAGNPCSSALFLEACLSPHLGSHLATKRSMKVTCSRRRCWASLPLSQDCAKDGLFVFSSVALPENSGNCLLVFHGV